MTVSVALPALGESVTEGAVTRGLKQVGDRVEAGEPLLEVSTDKVDTEIPSPAGGVLLEITVAEDETVEVGAALGAIGSSPDGPGPHAGRTVQRPGPSPLPRPRIRPRHRSRPPGPLARAAAAVPAAPPVVARPPAHKPPHCEAVAVRCR